MSTPIPTVITSCSPVRAGLIPHCDSVATYGSEPFMYFALALLVLFFLVLALQGVYDVFRS